MYNRPMMRMGRHFGRRHFWGPRLGCGGCGCFGLLLPLCLLMGLFSMILTRVF